MNLVDIDTLTYLEVDALIAKLRKRSAELAPAYWEEEHRKAQERSAQRAEQQKKIDAEALRMFGEAEVGDLVMITGMRDSRYPYRQITAITNTGFTGWQVRPNRDGTFQRGPQHTDHMAKKIRGLYKGVDVIQ
jgi:hypothetical protein